MLLRTNLGCDTLSSTRGAGVDVVGGDVPVIMSTFCSSLLHLLLLASVASHQHGAVEGCGILLRCCKSANGEMRTRMHMR